MTHKRGLLRQEGAHHGWGVRVRAQGELMFICLVLSFRDWMLTASAHPSPASVDAREVLLQATPHLPWVSYPQGQGLLLALLQQQGALTLPAPSPALL